MKIRALTAVAAGALLIAGAGAAAPAQAAAKKVTVEFLTVQNPTDTWPTTLQSLTKAYNAKFKQNVQLKISTYAQGDAYNQQTQLRASQGKLPLLYNVLSNQDQPKLFKKGMSADIVKLYKQLGIPGALAPAAADSLKKQFGGVALAVPFELNIEGFWYNKKMLADNGIAVPKTFEDLSAAAATLKAKGIQPFAASGMQGWPVTRIIGVYAQRVYGPTAIADAQAGTKVTYEGAPFVRGAKLVADWGKKGYFGDALATLDYMPAMDVFLQGKAAFFYMGSWALGQFTNTDNNKIGLDNVGFMGAPLVTGGKGVATEQPINTGLGIAVNPKLVNADTKGWLKYVLAEYGNEALKLRGQITGITVTKSPASVPALTVEITKAIAKVKNGMPWFESSMTQKAGDFGTHNVVNLASGSMSPADFLAGIVDNNK